MACIIGITGRADWRTGYCITASYLMQLHSLRWNTPIAYLQKRASILGRLMRSLAGSFARKVPEHLYHLHDIAFSSVLVELIPFCIGYRPSWKCAF